MSEMGRNELLGVLYAYADSIEQDMHWISAKKEDGTLTEGEADEILARLAGEHDVIRATIAEFRKHQ